MEEDGKVQPTNSIWNSNRIMGMAAIFISILSMFAVVYQSYLAREENELNRIQQSASVLPYLTHWNSSIDGEFKFVIANKGVGPAFIKEVKFMAVDFKNKDTIVFTDSNNLFDFIKKESALFKNIPAIRSRFKANILLSQNERKELIAFPYENQNQASVFKEEFYKYLAGFSIRYEDVYGAAWTLNLKENYPQKLEVN